MHRGVSILNYTLSKYQYLPVALPSERLQFKNKDGNYGCRLLPCCEQLNLDQSQFIDLGPPSATRVGHYHRTSPTDK
jgi:hypothetical protein